MSENPKIYAVKATAGQERVVAELLYREANNKRDMIKAEGGAIYSVLYTTGLKGYVLVEANSPGVVDDLAREVPKTRGLLLKEKGNLESAGIIPIEDLEKTLTPTSIVSEVSRGDLIELIAGPFKGEKARVARIDKDKNEITVELIEAAVPIPVIVSGDDIKVLVREKDD
ncbi:MAG: transcription elongation factor Spt5 [Candidatus Altiarchaeales archaeon]|nr:transcription elongation factor Spt5 [Candidatus Altiarchaeales archaeon]MBD3416697.1 transcription elongation factor Spt5 [Candidatus Altiarchaeales archaeon]